MTETTKVRIAIASSRELEFEVDDPRVMMEAIEAGLDAGDDIVWVVDTKGNRIGIRVQSLAFVEIEDGDSDSVVGFGS